MEIIPDESIGVLSFKSSLAGPWHSEPIILFGIPPFSGIHGLVKVIVQELGFLPMFQVGTKSWKTSMSKSDPIP